MENVSTEGAFDDELFLSSMNDPNTKAQRNKRLGEMIVLTACGVELHRVAIPESSGHYKGLMRAEAPCLACPSHP